MAATQGSTHGGAREGAGRKPKTMLYADNVDALEKTIVDVLPKVVDKLVAMAMDGNVAAAKYLVDRILGRPSRLTAPPATDQISAHEQVSSDRELFQQIQGSALPGRPSKPARLLPFGGMSFEELSTAAFGPHLRETPAEKFKRAIQADLTRRDNARSPV